MKKLWSLLVTSFIGIAILCGLGTWQIFRLAEKTKLIATLEARLAAPPIGLAEAITRKENGEDIEYTLVQTVGRSDPTHALAKVSSFEGSPGWEIIVPFTSTDGIFVLLDSGPSSSKQVTTVSADNETFIGTIRLHKKGRGLFDNDNDEDANTWYWWDLPAMQAAARAPQDAKIAQFILQKPDGNHTAKVELSNNHLGYAITWFGLATALATVAGFFALDRMKREG